MKEVSYERLSYRERVIIETLWKGGYTKTRIADQLGRHKSTISRELKRWVTGASNSYDAKLSHWYAEEEYATKHFKDKISSCKRLRKYVFSKLRYHWSPEQVAGRIRQDYPEDPEMRISHEAIYQYIYRHRQGKVNKELIKLLPQKRSYRRKTYVTRGVSQAKIVDTLSIDQRPAHINDRSQVGHWEGDLMIGQKQASAIATLVERKTRFTFILKVSDRRTETVTGAIKKAFDTLPPKLKQSMTYDNGFEMANHRWLTQNTGATVYFAHPYSSWERGTNENTNGLIRRFFPKGTDFDKVSYRQMFDMQTMLNNRPRKVLGYRTPLEAIKKHFKSYCRYRHRSVNVRK